LGQIQSLTDLAKAHEQESAQRYQQIQELSRLLKTAGRDAADRMAQLEKIAPQVSLLEAENRDLRGQLDAYAHWLKDAKRDVETITMAHREAEKTALAAMEEIARLKGPAQSQN
jgi:ABC-type transporter Mla subunit MlaD